MRLRLSRVGPTNLYERNFRKEKSPQSLDLIARATFEGKGYSLFLSFSLSLFLSFSLSLFLLFSRSLVLSFSRSLLLSFPNYLFLSKFLSLSFLLIPSLPSSFTVSSIFCSSLFVSILLYTVIVYLCFLIDWPFLFVSSLFTY